MRCLVIGLIAISSFLISRAAPDAQDKAEKKAENKAEGGAKLKLEIGGKSLDQWIAEIRDRDPGVRENAIRTVTLFGQLARKAVPALIAELNDRDASPRINAAIALGVIGLDQKDLRDGINGLTRLLSDNQLIIRYQAALALAHLGPDARPAIPRLVSTIKDYGASWEVRKAAAFALGRTSGDPEDADNLAVRALREALGDSCAQVRVEALSSLFRLGPPDQWSPIDRSMTMQTLRNLQNDRDKTVVIWSYMVQMRFDNKISEQYLAPIGKFLTKSPDLPVRTQAARAIGMIGTNGKSQVPNLIAALNDKEPLVVMWSIAALKEMGDKARPAIPALTDLANHKSDEIKVLAKDAIVAINQDGKKKMDKPKEAPAKNPPTKDSTPPKPAP